MNSNRFLTVHGNTSGASNSLSPEPCTFPGVKPRLVILIFKIEYMGFIYRTDYRYKGISVYVVITSFSILGFNRVWEPILLVVSWTGENRFQFPLSLLVARTDSVMRCTY